MPKKDSHIVFDSPKAEGKKQKEKNVSSPEKLILSPGTKRKQGGSSSGPVIVKSAAELRTSAASIDEAEELISKALLDWKKTKDSSPSPAKKRKRNRNSSSIHAPKLNPKRKSQTQTKEQMSELVAIPVSRSASDKIERKKTVKHEKKESENDPPPDNDTPKEKEVKVSVAPQEEENEGTPSTPEPEMRRKKQLTAYRRISQKFNRKSIMEKKKPLNDHLETTKREPMAKLQRQDSEMVLDFVNKKLQAEGKQGVNNAERKWLLKNMGQEPSPIVVKKKSIKSKTEHINQLTQKLSMMELNLNEINRRFETERDERQKLEKKLTEAEDNISGLEDTNRKLKQAKQQLSLKLDTLSMTAEERDKSIEIMEQKMLTKLSKAADRESKMAGKLKLSLSSQSKMETQLIQLRGDKTNLEYDRQEAFAALEKANNLITKLQQNNGYLNSELEVTRSSKENLQNLVSNDKKDLKEAYDYIGLLEDSDIKLRTAVALVNKQNKALSGINSKLKQQLGEANAQLAMQQFYNDIDEDIDGNIELLTSAVWDEPEPTEDETIPPPPPPPELASVLSNIPNYVAERKRKRAELAPVAEDPLEMADLFAKALLQRRDKISDDPDVEYSSGDEWEDSE